MCSVSRLGWAVLRLGKAITPPQRITFRPSDYSTLKGKESTLRGVLVAEVIIDTRGHVSSINVLQGLSPEFDALFLEEMKSSRFHPAKLEVRGVAVCTIYTARPHFR